MIARCHKPRMRVRGSADETGIAETQERVRAAGLCTVCEEAACPNLRECWARGQVTIMILGRVCTRQCRFCNVKKARPTGVDLDEPRRIGDMVARSGLRHVVITSVTRDDLPDGGAAQFVETMAAIREADPHVTIELLTPDFHRAPEGLESVVGAHPDVFGHNVEMVSRLYPLIRCGSSYKRSLNVLRRVKALNADMLTKSGIMLGLGEDEDEVMHTLRDLREVRVDCLTIGQYLQPSPAHWPVARYVAPEEFALWRVRALDLGFVSVSSGSLVRSSYHADVDFACARETLSRNSERGG